MGWTGILLLILVVRLSHCTHWTHYTDLDPKFRVFWRPGEEDITFEIQVRTLGYVGFGFSPDGKMAGADIVMGWIKDGDIIFQDRYALGREEPQMDPSQDYELLLGYENGTHSVFRFRRLYDTCDPHDFRITNDTMRIVYAYHDIDTVHPYVEGFHPYHGPRTRGSRSIYLMERLKMEGPLPDDMIIWDLTNPAVPMTLSEDNFYWCKIFRLPPMRRKHHMLKYEPLYQPGNNGYMRHVVLYECQGGDVEFEVLARDRGQMCYQQSKPPPYYNCNNVVIAWAEGSEGMSFPREAGYPLDPFSGPKYFLLETHYNNQHLDNDITDSSGMRLFYTPALRRHDAGVISVGLDPNWRHIIPPGQPEVVSEGHCTSACTQRAIPPRGIHLFAVVPHTRLIGRKIRLRHIRYRQELSPIIEDNNYDYTYQKYRRLQRAVTVYPGDHLIAECVYNSESRTTITLGGLTTREEMCLVFAYYYPRIELTMCRSLPSLPTVLHSLGIQQLWPGSSPVRIKSPPELADITLENRLISYDWKNHFRSFQETTHLGSFKPLCWTQKPVMVPGTENLVEYFPNITQFYREVNPCGNIWKKPGDDRATDTYDDGISVHESATLNNGMKKWNEKIVLIFFFPFVLLFL